MSTSNISKKKKSDSAGKSVIKVSHDPFKVVSDGDYDLLLFLLQKNECVDLNVNQIRWSGITLLHRAAEHGQTKMCSLLLEYGARINAKTTWGWQTPLHSALGNGYLQTAKFLLDNGADWKAVTKQGEDPVAYATKRGFKDVGLEFRADMVKKQAIGMM